MTKRGLAVVLGAGAAVLAVVVVPVAWVSSAGRPEPSSDPGAETVSLADWERDVVTADDEVRREANRVFESFAGTVEQRDALALVRAYEGNRSMDDCMAGAGFDDWDWSLARTYADPMDPFSTNVWLTEPYGRWRSQDLIAAKPFLLAEAKMNADDQSEAETAAVLDCSKNVPAPTNLNDEAPAIAERLSELWWDMVRDYRPDGMPGDEVYLACLDAADTTLLRGFGAAELGPAMTAASPPDTEIPSNPTDPGQWGAPDWQTFLRLEQEYLEADWACRERVYRAQVHGLAPLIEEFEAKHQAEIERAANAWADIVDRADALR